MNFSESENNKISNILILYSLCIPLPCSENLCWELDVKQCHKSKKYRGVEEQKYKL